MFEWIKNSCISLTQHVYTSIKEEISEHPVLCTATLIALAALEASHGLLSSPSLGVPIIVASIALVASTSFLVGFFTTTPNETPSTIAQDLEEARSLETTLNRLENTRREIDSLLNQDGVIPPPYEYGNFPHEAPPPYGSWNHG